MPSKENLTISQNYYFLSTVHPRNKSPADYADKRRKKYLKNIITE